jgi:hypothetical protein
LHAFVTKATTNVFYKYCPKSFTETSPAILDVMKLDLLGRKPKTYKEGSDRMKQLELPMQSGSS